MMNSLARTKELAIDLDQTNGLASAGLFVFTSVPLFVNADASNLTMGKNPSSTMAVFLPIHRQSYARRMMRAGMRGEEIVEDLKIVAKQIESRKAA